MAARGVKFVIVLDVLMVGFSFSRNYTDLHTWKLLK